MAAPHFLKPVCIRYEVAVESLTRGESGRRLPRLTRSRGLVVSPISPCQLVEAKPKVTLSRRRRLKHSGSPSEGTRSAAHGPVTQTALFTGQLYKLWRGPPRVPESWGEPGSFRATTISVWTNEPRRHFKKKKYASWTQTQRALLMEGFDRLSPWGPFLGLRILCVCVCAPSLLTFCINLTKID